ncbi:MAG: hypothetical protein J0M04_03095, partial [Verrucomicrobia bacterium]|nr:hypothetical protein [Verrucomicrobiota bacterium]
CSKHTMNRIVRRVSNNTATTTPRLQGLRPALNRERTDVLIVNELLMETEHRTMHNANPNQLMFNNL